MFFEKKYLAWNLVQNENLETRYIMADNQSLFFRGVYEFDDPTGVLLAGRVPAVGTVDLYSGTKILVKPGQTAIFVYNGKIADVLPPGNHEIKTENMPILTRLANWKFGFESPLRCELIFVSKQIFTGLKWGTQQPVLLQINGQSIPIRGYGTYNLHVIGPEQFFTALMGSRVSMELSDVQIFVQAQIQQVLAQAIAPIKDLSKLNTSQSAVAQKIQTLVVRSLLNYGLQIGDIRVLSLVPPEDTLHALDEKAAMQVIGDPQKYLLYKMANSFGSASQPNNSDPMHMMLSLMVGRGLMGIDDPDKKPIPGASPAQKKCPKCGSLSDASFQFCPHCGGGMNS
jgi:membrane protease subunit (stomatin/prohibitin family)